MHDVPQVLPTLAPPQVNVRGPPPLLPQIRRAHPLVVRLVIEVHVLGLVDARDEFQYSRGIFDRLQGGEYRVEGLGGEPGGDVLDGVRYMEAFVVLAVGRDGPQSMELVGRAEYLVEGSLLS